MARSLLPCLLLLALAQTALTAGVFELKIDSFTSSSGICGQKSEDCLIFFRVCLKHSQNVIKPEPPCTYGEAFTDVFDADSNSISEREPIRVQFQFKWPGTFSLIIEAWKADAPGRSIENPNNLISRLATRHKLRVGEDWTKGENTSNQSELHYSYHVVCKEFYHGEACSAYCRPRNDTFGHYTCDKEGKINCLEGWKGEYCTVAICAGCSEQHGFCKSPRECVCQQGWQGKSCDECVRHPGCKHGTCKLPWQCDCREGWGGLYCDQDLNYCTNHKPCQNGASCTNTGEGSYTCACRPGYTGKDCEVEVNECGSNPCRNGGSCNDSENDYSCTCPQGFYGKSCEISAMRCADGPCFNGGTCIQEDTGGYTYRCPSNFTGSNCEKRMDRCSSSSPCTNGAQCFDVGSIVMCRCQPGFTGSRCETNIDDCASNPCRNGGTCFDRINNYSCTCTLGFSGKDCTVHASLCDQFPCENGGTCFTHFTGPVCQCPRNFMGTRCEHSLKPTVKPAANGDPPAAMIAAIALGIVTFSLLVCAAIFVLRHLYRGRELRALSTSVKNDLETVNNRNAVIGGGAPKNGSLPGATLGSLKEKEAFLLPGAHLKMSNKDVALVDKGSDNVAMFKNKMADYNLAKEEQHLDKNKYDLKKCEPSVIVPPLSFAKDSLYHSVFIIPDQLEQCVFATEV
uniref:Delta-like protein n=2 Tax=Maylandia zebra TaxID=106582 RepID=A0A3P9DFF9_9CICH|nr:delta-like protein C isoform X4 [Maylandia zebra]